MTRLVPHPGLSGSVFVLWLLLNQSLSPGQLILGGAAALVGGWMFAALQPVQSRPRRLTTALRLTAIVLGDIIMSNISVALIILGGGGRERRSGFVKIPLKLNEPYGLAALACIITSTPGTLWVGLDSAEETLTIHVLDLQDDEEWIRTIKDRYERPLLEIFG